MSAKEPMILYIFPEDPVMLSCPTGFLASADLPGQEFLQQAISVWRLDPSGHYTCLLLREKEKRQLDLDKTLGENGVRHGDAVFIDKR